jgi:hypothetical protein
LLLPLERKSVEPMAARADPTRVGAAHQSLHHFVAKAGWSDDCRASTSVTAVLPHRGMLPTLGPVASSETLPSGVIGGAAGSRFDGGPAGRARRGR